MNNTKINLIGSLYILCCLIVSCSHQVNDPKPFGAIPSQKQINWQKMEYYMFAHFGPNTFTNIEWGNGKEDPNVFNPSKLDCRQWAKIAKDAGMKGIIITAKHHDGFCLWPSNQTTHSVKSSKWRNGKGDVLRELSDACREFNLKFGVYLSPWDRNHPKYGTDKYNEVFSEMLKEIYTNYGNVFEQWLDGANGGNVNQKYDWDLFHKTVYSSDSNVLIFSDVGPDCRWIGNEKGIAGETNWSTLNAKGFEPGAGAPKVEVLNNGDMMGESWIPGEADVSIRPGWFYSPDTDNKVKSLSELLNIYYSSVGRNANLLLNVPPDRTGNINRYDSIRLVEFKSALDTIFKNNLLLNSSVKASDVRGDNAKYGASNVLDNKYDSYWAVNDNVLTASLEINLKDEKTINLLLLQEYIPLGQRVAQFHIDYWNSKTNKWDSLIKGTTIGYKRILRFQDVTTSKLKIYIDKSLACPIINNVEAYFDKISKL